MNKEVSEIVGNGKPTVSARKETIAVSDTIRTSVQNQHSRARITSKGTCTTPFCEKWHPPECLGKSALLHTVRSMNSRVKGDKKNGDKSAVAFLKNTRQLGCVFRDMEPPKSSSILRKTSKKCRSQYDVFNSLKPCYITLTFETRIHRLE